MKLAILAATALFIIQTTGCSHGLYEESAAEKAASEAVVLEPSADLIRTHMAYLASDELLGREAGTPGYDMAADYVADEFRKLGLLPGGDNGSYFQDVTFRRSYRDARKVNLEVKNASGPAMQLESAADYLVGGSLTNAESNVTAEVVFAGYGLVAPEMGRDDYAGLDVEGKLVALLTRTPDGIQSEERAYYGSL